MDKSPLYGKTVLLLICGGVAAYKCLELIRILRAHGAAVSPVMTGAAAHFVTPMSVTALAGAPVRSEIFDLTDEAEMGHIELSRTADIILVAPATANMMAKMAHGLADDLASTILLATDTPVMIAPAMNVRMWDHPATRRNLATLVSDGILVVGPNEGDMACGEHGPGRMAEPMEIREALEAALSTRAGPLAGRRALVTSGPTHEPIDPVRYIANRSSGAQGAAIAAALRDFGADVMFVTGPAAAPPPPGVSVIQVETAEEMRTAALAALPADIGVFAAAVADWRVNASESKIKKSDDGALPTFALTENTDILREISSLDMGRPKLVIGFAAETDDLRANAQAKRARKGCDWLVANDVSPENRIMGGAENDVLLITEHGVEDWPRMAKDLVAQRLADRISEHFRAADA